jgi:hypothetical protein
MPTVGSLFSSSGILFAYGVGSIATILVFSYAAYWATSIRRALAVRTYRDQALGMSLISLFIAMLFLFLVLFATTSQALFFAAWQLSITATIIAVFYWADASILAARHSDPLLRDTLYWRRVRMPLWASLVVVLSIGLVLTLESSTPGSGITLGGLGLALDAFVGAVILPIASRRSRDFVLKRHLKWFALFIAFVFLSVFLPFGPPGTYENAAVSFPLVVLGGYFIYRSAKSLVPLNRISLTELTSPLSKETSLRPSTSLGHLVKANNFLH